MTIAHRLIGIDISKAHLDIHDDVTGKSERIANASAAIAAALARWPRAGLRVIFEATGSYDRVLRSALEAANVVYVRVNPARARDFARATSALAKTDAIDARLLAAMGRALALTPSQATDPLRERLTGLQRRRDQLVATRADDKKRLATAEDDEVRASIMAHIAWIDAEIARLQDVIDRLVAGSAELATLRKRLQTAPGVGPVTALTLIALMPELGQRSGKTSPRSPASPRSTTTAARCAGSATSKAVEGACAGHSTWPLSPSSERSRAWPPITATSSLDPAMPRSASSPWRASCWLPSMPC